MLSLQSIIGFNLLTYSWVCFVLHTLVMLPLTLGNGTFFPLVLMAFISTLVSQLRRRAFCRHAAPISLHLTNMGTKKLQSQMHLHRCLSWSINSAQKKRLSVIILIIRKWRLTYTICKVNYYSIWTKSKICLKVFLAVQHAEKAQQRLHRKHFPFPVPLDRHWKFHRSDQCSVGPAAGGRIYRTPVASLWSLLSFVIADPTALYRIVFLPALLAT